ncbi:pyrroline-5-carboxylate reductase [Aquibacillus koreensis]|uniref:Pyrroline-5-carboxylate reductase n=1 Tax=Aquibacillus koreensis TaxID=279446 RepID=A0A9X3WLT7_9BACI|nr:pyrroline-5-carboxylate reductase [Aquibacillus koreensis]MCT2536193.1 pyrroline-5-carboxylate reductase [Aquibacillus koreensis]MDC3422117.1 pyrroline-5-carboxylate reductase [Aquibacillus koreensis]
MISNKKQVLFLGAGRMAQAIISGLINDSSFHIMVTNNGDEKRLRYVQDTFNVEVIESWREEMESTDIIVLALPPEGHDSILKELAEFVDQQLIITVAAGIGPAYLEERLPNGTPVAWVMPNTAAQVGKSTTLFANGSYMTAEHETWLQAMLQQVGTYEQVTEQQVHHLTPITGSAPAFVYKMAESLIRSAEESGITEQQAQNLVSSMLEGAAAMLQTGQKPSYLTDQVATPGGVTAAGLEVLDESGLDQMLQRAIAACHERAKH